MATYYDSQSRPFTSGATIGEHLRVKLSSGVLALAGVGASDETLDLGQTERPSVSGEVVSVRLRNAQGTSKMVAAAAIAAGVAVYGAANGQISTTASGTAIGITMEAATAAGDVIEVMRY